jgi:tripartite-type tricarboxylate transporter receptor subunit TctC
MQASLAPVARTSFARGPLAIAAQAAITDIVGGQIHLMFDNMSSIVPHVKAGRLRGLGVTSLTRAPSMPDLPAVA